MAQPGSPPSTNVDGAIAVYDMATGGLVVVDNATLDANGNAAFASVAAPLAAGYAIANPQFPRGITNHNSAVQSTGQLSAATPVYLTNSNLALPAAPVNGIAVGTVLQWRVAITKNANGTGAFSMLIYAGTHGSTSDTAKVTQSFGGTPSAAVDTMVVDITVVFTAVGANGSFFWSIAPVHQGATATGFGLTVATGTFTGTVSSFNTTTAGLIFGLGVEVATGGTLPTLTVPWCRRKLLIWIRS